MTVNQTEADGRPVKGSEAGVQRTAEQGKGPRWKRIAAWVLVVLACILSVLSVVTVFARNQLLNTDTYVKTVAPLASNPAIQTQIAKQVSENLISRANVETRVKNALPPKAGFLATPITSGLESADQRTRAEGGPVRAVLRVVGGGQPRLRTSSWWPS